MFSKSFSYSEIEQPSGIMQPGVNMLSSPMFTLLAIMLPSIWTPFSIFTLSQIIAFLIETPSSIIQLLPIIEYPFSLTLSLTMVDLQ